MNIKITADSTCDLPVSMQQQYNISIVPFAVEMGGETYRDGVDITIDQIFDFVDSGKGMARTSAVNMAEYYTFFEPLSREYDAVIHLNLSAELSSSHQNAVLAAGEFDNVYVVDSRNLSTGTGLLVLKAAQWAAEGLDPEAICENLKNAIDKVEASFVIETMDYLVKGGRCSAMTAVAASVLKIKPGVLVKDGKMDVYKKFRGSFKKSLGDYVKERLESFDDYDPSLAFITHTRAGEETIAEVKAALEESGIFNEIVVCRAGATISCHCGPGTLGVIFMRK